MAGNDGDLLKQATQAMMSRYEGKKMLGLAVSSAHRSRDALEEDTSGLFSGPSLQLDERTKFCTDPLCTDCARVLVRLRVVLLS